MRTVKDGRKLVAVRQGEERAAIFLGERGVRILERNVRYRDGEIDLVGDEEGTLLFVEVKRRRSAELGLAAEAVTRRKRDRIIRAARRWLALNRGRHATARRPVRFDVVSIQDDPASIDWLRGAFDASAPG
jgi:putative endonuclease